jgi:hypothetical protein
MLNCGTL